MFFGVVAVYAKSAGRSAGAPFVTIQFAVAAPDGQGSAETPQDAPDEHRLAHPYRPTATDQDKGQYSVQQVGALVDLV